MVKDGLKNCPVCEIWKPLSDFTIKTNSSGGKGYSYECKPCNRLRWKAWELKNKDKVKLQIKAWQVKNKDLIKIQKRSKYMRTRDERLKRDQELRYLQKLKTFEMYGNKCACCGEDKKEFLCIDHIQGGGAEERREYGCCILDHVKKQGYPKDKYQLLCYNCNMSLAFMGYCPHHPEITRPRRTGRRKEPNTLFKSTPEIQPSRCKSRTAKTRTLFPSAEMLLPFNSTVT